MTRMAVEYLSFSYHSSCLPIPIAFYFFYTSAFALRKISYQRFYLKYMADEQHRRDGVTFVLSLLTRYVGRISSDSLSFTCTKPGDIKLLSKYYIYRYPFIFSFSKLVTNCSWYLRNGSSQTTNSNDAAHIQIVGCCYALVNYSNTMFI